MFQIQRYKEVCREKSSPLCSCHPTPFPARNQCSFSVCPFKDILCPHNELYKRSFHVDGGVMCTLQVLCLAFQHTLV